MTTFIIETSLGGLVLYSLIEAENVEEAIDIKTDSASIGSATVTGATGSVKTTSPYWGSSMQDVTLDTPSPPPNKYSLRLRP